MENSRVSRDKRYNLSDFEVDFKNYLSAVISLRPVSIKNYLSDVRYFSGWLATHTNISFFSEISRETIDSYTRYLVSAQMPEKSLKRRLSTLRTLFQFAIAQEWMDTNPAKASKSVVKSISQAAQSNTHHSESMFVNLFATDMRNQGHTDDSVVAHIHNINEFFSIIHSSQNYATVN